MELQDRSFGLETHCSLIQRVFSEKISPQRLLPVCRKPYRQLAGVKAKIEVKQAERVNKPMGEDTHPEVAITQEVDGSIDQPANGAVDNSRGTLIKMSHAE
jgi:hypothetical protein